MIADVTHPYRRHRRSWQRERRLLAVLALALVLLIYLGTVVYGGASGGTQVVQVRPGDTLWSIAAAHYPDEDVRAHVDELVQVNHLQGVVLTPGQTLTLPPS